MKIVATWVEGTARIPQEESEYEFSEWIEWLRSHPEYEVTDRELIMHVVVEIKGDTDEVQSDQGAEQQASGLREEPREV